METNRLKDSFLKQVRNKPDKLALYCSGLRFSYKQLYDKITQLNTQLEEYKFSEGEAIGLVFANEPAYIISLFAMLMKDYPVVMLSSKFSGLELTDNMRRLKITHILSSPKVSDILSNDGYKIELKISEDIVFWKKDVSYETIVYSKEDFICQLSSGTNGIPKAVVRTYNNVWTEIDCTGKLIDISEKDHVLTLTPIHHSYGLIAGTLMPLVLGLTVSLIDNFIPSQVVEYISNQKVTVVFAVPFTYHLLNETFISYKYDFSSVRYCFSAGAPIKTKVKENFYTKYGKVISQDYGSTETGVICLNVDQEKFPTSVGVAVTGEIKIFSEDNEELANGEIGEIRVKSRATTEKFLYPKDYDSNCFHQGWYKTGDLGCLNKEGYIFISGRKSSIINVAGLKVDPVEVENTILKLNGIKEVAVVGVASDNTGQMLKAYVTLSIPYEVAEIVTHCKKYLSRHKIPKIVEIIDELPKSQTGKVLKKLLINN